MLAATLSALLTVGSTLPNEVSVEFMVNVDLYIVHPINLQGKNEHQQMNASIPGHLEIRRHQDLPFLS